MRALCIVKYSMAYVSNNLNSCLLIVNTVDKIYLLLIAVAPLSEFREGSDEERRCRHALCLCELEMVRCMGHNKDEIDTAKILHQQCNITGKTSFQDEMICIIIHTSYFNKSLSKVKKKNSKPLRRKETLPLKQITWQIYDSSLYWSAIYKKLIGSVAKGE